MSSFTDQLVFSPKVLSDPLAEDEILARRKLLIKQTWRSVEFGLGEKATRSFYERLFSNFPEVQPMFENVSMKEQAHKLYSVLRLAVRSLDDLEAILPTVQELGRRHAQSYGVARQHYEAVTDTFVDVLHEYICSQCSNMGCSTYMVDVADAWSWCLNFIGGIMADAAEKAVAES